MLELMMRTQSGPHPADFSPERINLVFQQYSVRWNAIGTEYVENCYRCTEDFAREAVRFIIKDVGVAERLLAKEVLKALRGRKDAALETLVLMEKDRGDAAMSMNPGMWMGSRQLVRELDSTSPKSTTAPSRSSPAPSSQKQSSPGTQSDGSLGTQAKKEFEELESVRRDKALRLLQNMITLYKAYYQ